MDTCADSFYEHRRDSLLNTLTEMERRYCAFPDEPQLPTLCATTKRLKEFAAGILHFFNAGFASKKLKWDEYPPNNVYSILLNQIAYDIEVIQRAADQRITSGSTEMKQRLKEADNLAWQALQKAVGADKPLAPGTTVVTYFNKSPQSRVIPYANVALIGIPYTCVDEPRDLLATPHEVGHYIFWHARNQVPSDTGEAYYFYRTLIKQAVDELRALITFGHTEFDHWCHLWLEELFADAYGSWVAGPVSALTQQDNQANRATSEFAKTDGEHPAPVLRPYTAWKVLDNRAVDANILNLLDNYWKTILDSYHDPKSFARSAGPNIIVAEAVEATRAISDKKPVDQLVKLVIKRLSDFSVPTGDWRNSSESTPTTATELYAQFESYRQSNLTDLQVISQPESQLSGPANFKEWATTRFVQSPDLAALIENPDYAVTQPIPEAEWLSIMEARGWTTEGPEPNWP